MASPESFEKRQRERRKQRKREEKMERRLLRNEEKKRARDQGEDFPDKRTRVLETEPRPFPPEDR